MSTVGIFFILAVVLLAIGVPVAATLGLAAVVYILLEGIPTSVVIQQMFAGVDVVVLMCIPFFILAGDLMAKGGIAKRLVRVANLVVGNITGGLAYVTIIVCALFAAMTGSAMACCLPLVPSYPLWTRPVPRTPRLCCLEPYWVIIRPAPPDHLCRQHRPSM